MPPELIAAAIQSSAEAAKAYFTWLCTPEGQEFCKELRQDRAAAKEFWGRVGAGFDKVFSGELFKEKQ